MGFVDWLLLRGDWAMPPRIPAQDVTDLARRANCPCCGYPTILSPDDYDICELCGWEDDGQDDSTAEEVWGGPNGTYSLAKARENFERFLTMYSPDDPNHPGPDSPSEIQAKRGLISAFESIASGEAPERVLANVREYEGVLLEGLARKGDEYDRHDHSSTQRVLETLDSLKKEFPIQFTRVDEKDVEFAVEGIVDEFKVSGMPQTCIVSTRAWHEHVDDANGLRAFLHALFTGRIMIDVIYRGQRPVGHAVRDARRPDTEPFTSTHSVFFPAWRERSVRHLDYTPANKRIEPTAQAPYHAKDA